MEPLEAMRERQARQLSRQASLDAAAPSLLLWGEDLCQQLRIVQARGVYFTADFSDSLNMMEKAVKNAKGES